MWCFLEHRRPLMLFDISHYPAHFRQAKHYMDNSGQHLLILLVHTAEIQPQRLRLRRCRGPLSGRKREQYDSYSHPRWKRHKKTEYVTAWVIGLLGSVGYDHLFFASGETKYTVGTSIPGIIFDKRRLWVRPIEWLKLNFASCLKIRHTRWATYSIYFSNMVFVHYYRRAISLL